MPARFKSIVSLSENCISCECSSEQEDPCVGECTTTTQGPCEVGILYEGTYGTYQFSSPAKITQSISGLCEGGYIIHSIGPFQYNRSNQVHQNACYECIPTTPDPCFLGDLYEGTYPANQFSDPDTITEGISGLCNGEYIIHSVGAPVESGDYILQEACYDCLPLPTTTEDPPMCPDGVNFKGVGVFPYTYPPTYLGASSVHALLSGICPNGHTLASIGQPRLNLRTMMISVPYCYQCLDATTTSEPTTTAAPTTTAEPTGATTEDPTVYYIQLGYDYFNGTSYVGYTTAGEASSATLGGTVSKQVNQMPNPTQIDISSLSNPYYRNPVDNKVLGVTPDGAVPAPFNGVVFFYEA